MIHNLVAILDVFRAPEDHFRWGNAYLDDIFWYFFLKLKFQKFVNSYLFRTLKNSFYARGFFFPIEYFLYARVFFSL